MLTYDITTINPSKIRGKWLKMKVLPHFLNPDPIDYFDPIRQPLYHAAETLKHFRYADAETSRRVYRFYYEFIEGWRDTRGYPLTIENSVLYIKHNLGLK